MSDNNFNNTDDNNYESICSMCHRPESITGKQVKFSRGGLSVCTDCMQRTLNMTEQRFNNMNTSNGSDNDSDDENDDTGFGMNGGIADLLNGMMGGNNPFGEIDIKFTGGPMFGDGFFSGDDDSEDSYDSYDEDESDEESNEDSDEQGTGKENISGNNSKEDNEETGDGDNNGDNDNNDDKTEKKKNSGNRNTNRRKPEIHFMNMADIQSMMGGDSVKIKKRKPGEKKKPIIKLEDIPAPHEIKHKLDEYVIGQEYAKKVISVGVYNHYKRVAAEIEGDKDVTEIEKSNMLMIGPTGSGKTYMVKTLAKLLDVPLAVADATSLTEAGYIGDDIESVISKLLSAAGNDVDKAESGIIFIDEIDKIAKKKDAHSRDVSGESVQQGLLKLLEGSKVEVPVGSNSKSPMVPMTTVDTGNILFICGGAFPGLEDVVRERLNKQSSMGFVADLKDKYTDDNELIAKATTEDLRKYGMIPEFLGRLPVLFTLEGLTPEKLVAVLKEPKNAIIKQYQKLLELDEVRLEFTDDALYAIAEKASEKKTGARALRSIIEEYMLDIMYEIPKDDNIGKVTITKDYIEKKGTPVIEMRGAGV